jgi:hypothetical protein
LTTCIVPWLGASDDDFENLDLDETGAPAPAGSQP